ncbi:hypothetical protein [Aquitalea sp. ASV11]|uniref:hypothetical protein n=1 Tax=Aquitalea sp. ASV11 TaxID=2795103 RepID=UPI0018EC8302|nr:hypothetical protein [Aquitalea sp. ASV11]
MPGNIIFCNSTGLRRTVVFLFVFCIIQFSSAWIYPASSFSGIGSAVQEKFLGVPFQYCLWLVVSLCFYLDSRRSGLTFYSRVLLPISPFILIGFASSIFGVMPFDSLRYLILFLVMCVSSVLPVSVLPLSVMEKYFFNIFSGIVVISLIYGVAFPDYGVQAYGIQRALRGFFTNKNQFGWFSAISLIIIVVFFDV